MSRAASFALFDTPIGACAIAWSGPLIRRAMLPDTDAAALANRLNAHGFAQAAPSGVAGQAVARITSLLAGSADDLADLPLDMGGINDFARAVYAALRRIAPGQTATYGQVAAGIGKPGAARAVGHALARNPFAIIVPCHRVVASTGIGGFTSTGGLTTKRRLLALEGAALEPPDLFGP